MTRLLKKWTTVLGALSLTTDAAPGLILLWMARQSIGVRFGNRIRSLREQRGWTLAYLAAHSGISKTFLTNLETAKKEPCLFTIETLAASFDLTVGKLMRGL